MTILSRRVMADQSSRGRELRGWQAIASYLNVSKRHVQRLEKEGLPIHRSEKLRHVVAYIDELEEWRGINPPEAVKTQLSHPPLSEERDLPEEKASTPETEACEEKTPEERIPAWMVRFLQPFIMFLLGMLTATVGPRLFEQEQDHRQPLSGEWHYEQDAWIGRSTEAVGRLDTGYLVGPGSQLKVEITPSRLMWSGGIEIFQDQTHWTYLSLDPHASALTLWRYPSGLKMHLPSSRIGTGDPVSIRVSLSPKEFEIQVEDEEPVLVPIESADTLSGKLFYRTGKHDDEWSDGEPGSARFRELEVTNALTQEDWIPVTVPEVERTSMAVVARLYNGDDQLDLLLNGKRVASTGYREEALVQLAPYLRSGRHTLTLRVLNRRQGITYGVRLDHGDEIIWEEACGIAGERRHPCERLGSQLGLVEELSQTFEVP